MGARSDHSDRTAQERVRRLKERLEGVRVPPGSPIAALKGVLQGILDLLADEL